MFLHWQIYVVDNASSNLYQSYQSDSFFTVLAHNIDCKLLQMTIIGSNSHIDCHVPIYCKFLVSKFIFLPAPKIKKEEFCKYNT